MLFRFLFFNYSCIIFLLTSYLQSHFKFGLARLASVGTHDKYIQDQPWSSLSVAYHASIMLIDPKLCW